MKGRTKLVITVTSAAVGLLGLAAVVSPVLANAAAGPAAAPAAVFQNISGYCVTGRALTGGTPRVSAPGSSKSC